MARLKRTRRGFSGPQELKAAAEAGDAEALRELAVAHATGKGAKKDKSLAFHLFMQAAEAGDALAMAQVADIFRTGEVLLGKVTPIDLDRAVGWYKKSAAAGNHEALFGLARIYQQRQEHKLAAATFKESAYRFGKRESLREYGMCLYHGNGLPQDVEEGRRLIAEAALMDEEFSALGRAYLAQNYGVSLPMPAPEERPKRGAALARFQFETLVKRAEAGDVDGQVELAFKYVFGGKYHEKNRDKAFAWFRRAAEAGDAEAQFEMGRACDEEHGKSGASRGNPAEAFAWYRKAAGQGYRDALREAGRCLYFGEGAAQDRREAARFFEQAAALGDPEAMVFFGWMLQKGESVRKDAARGAALVAAALEADKAGVGLARARLDQLEAGQKKKNG